MNPTALTSVMTTAAAAAGSAGVRAESAWYQQLEKPSWQPPPVAFPLVWTPLYTSIAWSTGRALAATPRDQRGPLWALTAGNLVVNAGWNWAFFAARSPAGGLAVITALNALNVRLVREAGRRDRTAGKVLLPYAAWCGFATALNASIWRRNR
jgi:tryptophan-rich sensory protein